MNAQQTHWQHIAPRKTDAARQLLLASRQSLPPGLRMLLITVDGRKTFAELGAFARGLGLADSAFERLQAEGLIAWSVNAPQAPAQVQAHPAPPAAEAVADPARRLVRAKFFAMDLAASMLAGQDQGLREQARGVDSESSFQSWLDECTRVITQAGGAERAALFRERVAATV